MKRILLTLTVGALMACPAIAQPADSTNTPPPGPPPGEHHHGMDFLTEPEKTELQKAHDEALAADPSLVKEEDSVKADMKAAHDSGNPPSDEVKEKMHAFQDKLDAAMIKADSAVAPIIEKIKAHRHHGPGGPPPPPPAGA